MANLVSASGYISSGGGVFKLSTGTVVALFYTTGVTAVKDADGTPTQILAPQSTTTMFGGVPGNLVGYHGAIDSNDDLHIVALSNSSTATRSVAYGKLSSIDGTPSFSGWSGIVVHNDDPSYTDFGAILINIRVDSNDYPRVVWMSVYFYKGSNYHQPYYSHDVGSGWITPERVDTADTGEYHALGMELTSDDDVEVVYIDDSGTTLYHRRRNGSWGTRNSWSSTSPDELGNFPVGRNGSDTVYRYAELSGNVYENDSDSGEDVESGSVDDNLCTAVLGTYRWMLRVLPTDDDLYVSYNSGSGWTEELLVDGGCPSYALCANGYRNNGWDDGVLGYLYMDGSSDLYYDEYDAGGGAAGVPVQMDHYARLRRV